MVDGWKIMADIINGLFGVDPAQYQQQQQLAQASANMKLAQMDPLQARKFSVMQAGTDLGNLGMNLLGIQDPMMQKATMAKQLASQFDLTTSDGLKQYAQALAQQGAPDLAQMAFARSQEVEKTTLSNRKLTAETEKIELSAAQEEKLRKELAALGPMATEKDIINVVSRYGSPDKILSVLTGSLDRRARIAAASAGEGGVGQAGPVGKAGAYRDINGMVHGVGEMKIVNEEFRGAEKLMQTLNDITATDVKNAKSFVDWTERGSTAKAFASSKTLQAQSKIAASQLMQQIESLPKGSASDADMRAAMKNFPGYSDPAALAEWVNETKIKLQRSLTRLSDQFGLRTNITSSGKIDLKAQPASATNDEDLIAKHLK